MEFPRQATYVKVAKYEQKLRNLPLARQIFEKAMDDLGALNLTEEYYIQFAKFETFNKEFQRAREIYKFGLEKAKSNSKLYQNYLSFEKQLGQKEEIDSLVLEKRRGIYKAKIAENALDYDAWFDLLNLEMSTKAVLVVRETFELAVLNVPPVEEKRYWRRYIYLWYAYALFEEVDVEAPQNAVLVVNRAVQLTPHKKFSFTKLWIHLAQLHVRLLSLEKARLTLGKALALHPSTKIYLFYISLELSLLNLAKVRNLIFNRV